MQLGRAAKFPPCTAFFHIGYSSYRLTLTCGENGFWKHANIWPVGHTLAQLSLCFVPHHPLMSYCLWLCLILDIMKICMDFGLDGAFSLSDVPKMVDQQNSWNSLVMGTYLLYLEWNVGMFAVNICILWPPTTTQWPGRWWAAWTRSLARAVRNQCGPLTGGPGPVTNIYLQISKLHSNLQIQKESLTLLQKY
jgi:hypothetical protein